MEDHSKVVKSPVFLEIVEYKLKNRIYHKVEHAVKDFRRIIHSARLYHQVIAIDGIAGSMVTLSFLSKSSNENPARQELRVR